MKSAKKIIYTNHAIERRVVRRISKKAIQQTVLKPDSTEKENDGDTEFKKTVDGRKIHAIAKPLPDQQAWLIKTVWVRGEDDPNIIVKLMLTLLVKAFKPIFK